MNKTFTITLKLTVKYDERISYSDGMQLTKSLANTIAGAEEDLLKTSWMKTYLEVGEPQLEEGNTFGHNG